MMDRLWSTPPHTLGTVSPACLATSTNWTGDVVGAATAACSRSAFLHRQSGVARASVRLPPSRNRDEPRKRRRGNIIPCDDYRDAERLVCERHKQEGNGNSLGGQTGRGESLCNEGHGFSRAISRWG